MKQETLRAVEALACGTFSLVVVNGEKMFTSENKGIKPILEILDTDSNALNGASAADRVIGGAAAFLLVYGGVAEVYGEIMSEKAAEVLENAGIAFSYGALVPHIKNRKGDDLCPLEKLCLKLKSPQYAFTRIKIFLKTGH